MSLYSDMCKKEEQPNYKCPKISLQGGVLTPKGVAAFANIEPEHFYWSNIDQLNKVINRNLWIKYFIDNKYEKDNWIDFEREIEKVILMVKLFFDTLPTLYDKKIENSFDRETISIIELFSDNNNGFPLERNRSLLLDDINQSKIDGLKKNIIRTMVEHLDDLIDGLKIYFVEFVDKIDIKKITPAISKIKNAKVLNFNYTDYILRYSNVDAKSIHHIHGEIRDDNPDNNMVLGINDENVIDNDFVYFFKFFQRIQKRTGVMYKTWARSYDAEGYPMPYHVYVFGHSLDSNDKSILSYFFESEKVGKIIIFNYNQSAYETQVINLINMFGKDFVIENVSNNRIQFFSIQECELTNRPVEIK